MVKVYVDILIRVCVREYVSLNIKNVDKIVSVLFYVTNIIQRSYFYEYSRFGKLLK